VRARLTNSHRLRGKQARSYCKAPRLYGSPSSNKNVVLVRDGAAFRGGIEMTLNTAVRACLTKYVTWSGRASRAEYWYFMLFYWLALIAAVIVDGAFNSVIPGALVLLGLMPPAWSVNVRRLHDTGRSGAWNWISLMPLVGGIVIFVFLVTQGDPGDNRYGRTEALPAPLAPFAENRV
jgi:uncharacterized membrane protein YhaH (DUF805 family)